MTTRTPIPPADDGQASPDARTDAALAVLVRLLARQAAREAFAATRAPEPPSETGASPSDTATGAADDAAP